MSSLVELCASKLALVSKAAVRASADLITLFQPEINACNTCTHRALTRTPIVPSPVSYLTLTGWLTDFGGARFFFSGT